MLQIFLHLRKEDEYENGVEAEAEAEAESEASMANRVLKRRLETAHSSSVRRRRISSSCSAIDSNRGRYFLTYVLTRT